jgi:Domain of unknown function (DUF3806)
MRNPFRRKPDAAALPEPEWPPIQELDSIDFIGKRPDGGVDLIITASQPIDDSTHTLGSIRHKVRTYLKAIGLDAFQAEMGHPPREKCAIILVCQHPIHAKAEAVIEECRAEAAAQGVRLEIRRSMVSTPSPAPEGNNMEQSIRPVSDDDVAHIMAQQTALLETLRSRYGHVQLRHTEDDLRWLQRLEDDGILQAGQEDEWKRVGIVFGQVLAARTPLRWITLEWQGTRVLGLQYPKTTVVVFPESMIVKRIARGERVEFESFFRAVVAQVEEMKDNPEYKR